MGQYAHKSGSRILFPALLIALASCGGTAETSGNQLTSFTLTSEAFADGQAIPGQYTCDGGGRPPALRWSEPPAGTKSFVLVVDDPDAPGGTFRHWGAFNIPASARSLQAGAFDQVTNDFGKPGYGGPCPPKGHGPHHYRFKLFALDTDRLGVSAKAKVVDVEREAEKHAIGRAELIGLYERR